MSKIICDVCGTSYPETADQCPICGCVRPVNIQGVISDNEAEDTKSGYTYVKGGRFSKANVKKRSIANQSTSYEEPEMNEPQEKEKTGTNKGLVITAMVLLLAIVAVIVYITVRFFGMGGSEPGQTQTATTAITTEATVPCTKLTATVQTIELSEIGSAWMLNILAEPSDTTDSITYVSSDKNVATVSDKGKVTAVGAGQATITVTCGEQTLECRVICDIQESTEETTEETAAETTEATVYTEEDLRLNRTDITFSYEGETWNIYSGSIPVEEITWSCGNSSVATIKNGVVTAVGNGRTTVYAKYGDMEVSCIIRCTFTTKETGITGSDNITEDG